MPRGGARPGAGRKPKKPSDGGAKPVAHAPTGVKEPGSPEKWPFGTKPAAEGKGEPQNEADERDDGLTPEQRAGMSPLDYLLAVMRSPDASNSARMQAAIQAAPYVHPKLAPAGKKDARNDTAKKASKFAASAPPLKLVSR